MVNRMRASAALSVVAGHQAAAAAPSLADRIGLMEAGRLVQQCALGVASGAPLAAFGADVLPQRGYRVGRAHGFSSQSASESAHPHWL